MKTTKWQKLLGIIVMTVVLATAACGGGDTVYVPSDNSGGGDGGTPPPNPNPNPQPQPPPVAQTARLRIPFKFAVHLPLKKAPKEIQVGPSLGRWRNDHNQGSYDSFLIRNPHAEMINGEEWSVYGPIVMERPNDTVNWVVKGDNSVDDMLFLYINLDNGEGELPTFANNGMPKYKVFLGDAYGNFREDPCITVAVHGGPVVNIENDTRTAHTVASPQLDGSFDWGGRWLDDCNGGDRNCASGCDDNIPDDDYDGIG